MNFTNINDPAGIKALLEQLRSSQAWQDSITSEHDNELEHASLISTSSIPVQPTTSDASDVSSSVATLLSQLKSSEWITPSTAPQPPSHFTTQQMTSQASQPASQPAPHPPEISAHQQTTNTGVRASTCGVDVRAMSFQQTLPHLTELIKNRNFITSINRLREEQKDLEKQLWEERLAIYKKHENIIKVAQTKAALIGAGISQHEADMMNNAFLKELQKFDSERVLFAWDALLLKQQSSLEVLRVPTMFPTGFRADREKQQKVIQVLEGIVSY